MSSLGEKVSYLKGLAEGKKIDASSNEGKLIVQMIDVLVEVTKQIDELQEAHQELNDYVECIDDDLEELELQFEGESDGDEEDDFDFDEDEHEADDDDEDFTFVDDQGDETGYQHAVEDDDDGEDEEETDDSAMYVGCLCPECGGMFCVDSGDNCDKLLICPHCGAKVTGVPMDFENVPMAKPAPEEPET